LQRWRRQYTTDLIREDILEFSRLQEINAMRVLGAELLHAPAPTLTRVRRGVGFIFQAHNLMPYLTALENVPWAWRCSPAGWRGWG